jgi:DNA replication protein DnaC
VTPRKKAHTLNTFDFEAVQAVSKAQVMALASGDAWLNNGANLLLFAPPGGGKSQLAAALGFALVGTSGACYRRPAGSLQY